MATIDGVDQCFLRIAAHGVRIPECWAEEGHGPRAQKLAREDWLSEFSDITDGELDRAVRAHLGHGGREARWWPVPATIRALLDEELEAEAEAAVALLEDAARNGAPLSSLEIDKAAWVAAASVGGLRRLGECRVGPEMDARKRELKAAYLRERKAGRTAPSITDRAGAA